MLKVWNCLEGQHDWRLVVAAGLVCFLTSVAAVSLFQRARADAGLPGVLWLLTAGLVTGTGVWSTHFIAILAYLPGYDFDYDLALTLLSLAAAMVMTTLGLAVAAWFASPLSVAVGGVAIGFGIAAMHYLGMASLSVVIIWDLPLAAASVVTGVVLSVGGIAVARRSDTPLMMSGAAVLLLLAIAAHHFIAMGAIELVPPVAGGQTIAQSGQGARISSVALSLSIAAVTIAFVAAGLFVATVDRSTHRRIALRSLELDAALNNMGQGLCMFDGDSRLQLWNIQYLLMYHLRPDDLHVGDSFERLLELRIVAGTSFVDLESYLNNISEAIAARVPADWLVNLNDGRNIHVTYQPMANGGWVLTHEDYTERVANRARIEFLAHHDALTQLPNRIAFDQHIGAEIARAARDGSSFAVICLDLDRFKDINDIYGHAAGDVFLREVARRLTNASQGAFVARVGGDEFQIVSSQGEQPSSAEALCSRCLRAFEEDFQLDGVSVQGGCSMGVAIYPENGRDALELIGNADAALYRVKADQRGSFHFFETSLDNSLREKRILHKELITAIEQNQFEAHFQPQVTGAGDLTGFEVLVRWRHPVRGLLAPAVFVPLAEETGLIRDIDGMMLREACREAASWDKPLSIAVNLSPVDFRRGDVAAMILAVLFETGLSPERLTIEITEGVLMEDKGRAASQLRRLKGLGVALAMDDFGTGYSSLSYLLAFPFDKIKIDKGFVAQLETNPQSRVVVRAIIGLGHSLGLTVIAEGVEDQCQFDVLANKGCDEFQGYLLGRPQPAAHYRGLRRGEGEPPSQQLAV